MSSNSNSSKELREFKYEFQGEGLQPEELKPAKKSFNEYKQRYHIDSLSDLHLLEELVYKEALLQRIKRQISTATNNKRLKDENYVPTHLHQVEDEMIETIVMLKEKLGLFRENNNQDPFQYIQILKKKFNKWMEENQGSRTFPCPHCMQMVMLKIRTDIWEAQKHSFFKDKILANEKLWKLYKEGKITKLDMAEVLGTSDAYVDWLEKKIYSKTDNPA
jgi:hypothetical protein